MDLKINRLKNNDTQCTGELFKDGSHFSWTLEDPVRDLKADGSGKIYGKTAIPAGRYKITVTMSPKFGHPMILVNDVQFFTGIRIHGGVDAEDTLGCPLVGFQRAADGHLGLTLQASAAILEDVKEALAAREEVWLDVVNGFPEEDMR